MRIITSILRLFNLNLIHLAAALLKAEIYQRCGFSGPIHEELRPFSCALDCFAVYEEANHA